MSAPFILVTQNGFRGTSHQIVNNDADRTYRFTNLGTAKAVLYLDDLDGQPVVDLDVGMHAFLKGKEFGVRLQDGESTSAAIEYQLAAPLEGVVVTQKDFHEVPGVALVKANVDLHCRFINCGTAKAVLAVDGNVQRFNLDPGGLAEFVGREVHVRLQDGGSPSAAIQYELVSLA